MVLQTENIRKDNTKDVFKTKPINNPKPKTEDGPKTMLHHSMYSKINFRRDDCNEEFKTKIALTTHSYSHNRKYLENTEYFDVNSIQKKKEFYITDGAGNYIEDIDEAINNSLEEIKNCDKSFKYEITAECECKKRTKEEVKITKTFFNTDYIINNAIYDYGDFKQWLDFETEIYEGYDYDFEFLGLRSVQINIEPTKASIGSYIDLPPISKSKYQNNIITPRQQHEDDFGYILRIQKLYNINFWIYTPCGDGK